MVPAGWRIAGELLADGRIRVHVAGALVNEGPEPCLLYTSDAADERSSVDLGGRRIIKKKNTGNARDQLSYR